MRLWGRKLALGLALLGLSACGAAEPPRSAAEIAAERSFLGPLPLGLTSSATAGVVASRTNEAQTRIGLMVAVGDAYTSGAVEGGVGAAGWAAQVSAHLGAHLINRGIAGTGYLIAGSATTFGERVNQVVADRPNLIIVWGARIDVGQPSGALEAAVRKALSALRAGLPAAVVVAIGPAWINADPPATYVAARNAEEMGAKAAGVLFLDPLAQNWFGGAGLMSSDGIHPTNAGFDKAAQFIEADLRAAGIG